MLWSLSVSLAIRGFAEEDAGSMNQLLLRGGTVVDGTGGPAQRADVLIDRGRIVRIDRDLTVSDEVIDVGGLVVAPGFIDTHSHSDLRVLADRDLPMKVRQGITLDVLGQDGISVAPVRESDVEQVRRQLAGLLGDPDVERPWRSVGEYLDVLDRGCGLNTSYLVPHGAVRACAMGLEARAPTAEELAQMVALVGQAMAEGALGMSTGLIYPPCCYADTDELVALNTEVAQRGGVFVVHMRSESDRILGALDEMIDVSRRSGVHLHISHFKIAGRDNWPRVDEMLAKVRAAQASGVRVTADQYPYVAGSTMFGAILPPWAHDGGVEATLQRLASDSERARMRREMSAKGPQDWDNFWKWTGPEGIVISDVPSGRRPELIGKTVAEASAGKEPLEFALDLLRDERMGVSMISFSQDEEVVGRVLREPYVNICTDGLLGGRPHPRAFGTYPRILGRYVRERGVLTLEEAVRKMSSQAADAMHLPDRGRVVAGAVADLVAFDAATVADRATFADPMQPPVGIEHVIVRGTPVLRDGQPTGARPGRVVRRAP
jgi:N-acyl-D-amino-acid deacylase